MALQEWNIEEIEPKILQYYEQMMRRFIQDRELVPEDQFVEVRYENLVSRPIEEIARVYDVLGLGGWENAAPKIAEYAARHARHAKNKFTLNEADDARVREHWGFSLAHWGYARPHNAPT